MGAGVGWGVSCSVKAGTWIWGKDIPDRESRDHEVMRPVCLERKQGDGGKG